MTPEPFENDDLLAATGEEEYGSGAELETTSFLVLGLLTFWIYTVWRYHALLARHASLRLEHFRRQRDPGTLSPEERDSYGRLVARGFRVGTGHRNVALALYATCVVLILSELVSEVLVLRGTIGMASFESWVYVAVGGAALAFCAASVQFMSWACRAWRDHEYNELLLARFVRDPAAFRPVRPSAKFVTRWNRNQSLIALFLVVSVPMTISPILAVREIHVATEAGVGFSSALVGWVLGLFVFAGIFHLWGTRLLLDMHNGHLRVEEISRQSLEGDDRWHGAPTAAVVDEAAETAGGAPGDLLPRRVVAAIMLTDMVGFSRDMEQSEERTYAKLMRHNEIVRASLGRHSGREIKTIGDAFLVHFRTALDAVRAAVEIQRALARYNQEHQDGERIVVRIGIHAGDVLTMDGDVLGNNVNLAARIEPQAEPGGICFSEDAYRQVRGALDLPASSLGRRPLKNIANPPELFQISRETIAAKSS